MISVRSALLAHGAERMLRATTIADRLFQEFEDHAV